MTYFKQQQNYAPDGWCLISWDAICHLSFFNHMSKRHSDVYHLSSNERLFHWENASITRKPHTIETAPHMYANQLNASSAQRISRFDTPLDLSGKQKPYPASQQHWHTVRDTCTAYCTPVGPGVFISFQAARYDRNCGHQKSQNARTTSNDVALISPVGYGSSMKI